MAFVQSLFGWDMIGAERLTVCGSFRPNGVTGVLDVKGKGFSVARTDVGEYTITFDAIPIEMVGFKCSVRAASLTNAPLVMGGAIDLAAKTLVLQVMAESATVSGFAAVKMEAVDLAANADNEVYFECTFRNTSVP